MGVVANEPSMEDILSSIKRIIADGSDRAASPRVPRRRSLGRDEAELAAASDEEASGGIDDATAADDGVAGDGGIDEAAMPHVAGEDEHEAAILELTEMVEEEAEIMEPVAVAPELAPAPQPARRKSTGQAAQPQADAIISDVSAQAARQSLSQLSSLLVRPQEGESSTLEGLVRELLRPVLKEWLDANLPDMVESLVKKEIDRIVGRLA